MYLQGSKWWTRWNELRNNGSYRTLIYIKYMSEDMRDIFVNNVIHEVKITFTY